MDTRHTTRPSRWIHTPRAATVPRPPSRATTATARVVAAATRATPRRPVRQPAAAMEPIRAQSTIRASTRATSGSSINNFVLLNLFFKDKTNNRAYILAVPQATLRNRTRAISTARTTANSMARLPLTTTPPVRPTTASTVNRALATMNAPIRAMVCHYRHRVFQNIV